MKLTEWRNRKFPFTLPSGLEVELRKVSLLDLAAKGTIPQNLMAPVEEAVARKPGDKFTLAELKKFAEVATYVASSCLAGPEGLTVEELAWEDIQAIYVWANEVSGKLEPFRKEQEGTVEPPHSMRNVRAEAK